MTLDKMPGIQVDHAKLVNNQQKWDFCQLVDSLRRWTERNHKTGGNPEKHFRRKNWFQVRDKVRKPAYVCVYCEKPGHKSNECGSVNEILKCRLILSKEKSYFDSAGPKQRAPDYRSNKTCGNCTIVCTIVKENITPRFVKKVKHLSGET